MKFIKQTANKFAVEQIRGQLHEHVETIESHADNVFRIQFKNIEIPAYLILDNKGVWKAIHYCESNEKGISCTHLNIIAFIASELKIPLEIVSAKNSIKEISAYPVPKDNYENINRVFGLFEPVEISEDEEEEDDENLDDSY